RIAGIILRKLLYPARTCGVLEGSLILLGKGIPLLEVDEVAQFRRALPETWIVIVRGDFHEPHFLVVQRADQFKCVDDALFQGGIDIAESNLLWNNTHALEQRPPEA